jgi:hypothetical protein
VHNFNAAQKEKKNRFLRISAEMNIPLTQKILILYKNMLNLTFIQKYVKIFFPIFGNNSIIFYDKRERVKK